MPVHPLTAKQLEWLRRAQARGYEGLFCEPHSVLTRLEKLGFVERDPTTAGRNTRWRIKERGERYLAGYEQGEA